MPDDSGIDIHEAGDVDTAMSMAVQLQPDIVVLDYTMPDKNGVELADEMQALDINSKYVLLTANTQKTVVEAANELGFVAIVEKPITSQRIQTLLDTISQ
jgi:CheY-like chemotaxis protein